ncbi:polysaccharide deacetylase family protein [Flavobacterium crassostreae]|uniref:Polysaccharide deacetylase n=1 Tax=Flavobacterium crassostreae TaxID=1763534 RepID=A0A1B9E9U1_9FLAO|nr:polysaccharide deacetylase family protein [Flavobacterium crassostreae]OCB78709.1 polysaccharide deacetylase [Flavobacterium crassostreae]
MNRLPILMYHNVIPNQALSSGLSIAAQNLESQFSYLMEAGFTSFHFSDLESKTILPKKSVVITFDDVTVNQLIYAVPLLKKYHLKATFFVPLAYLGKADLWNQGKEPIMTVEQLQQLDDNIELGLHSYAHNKYAAMSEAEIMQDFEKCFATIAQNKLKVAPILAYPYGNYPKKDPQKTRFVSILKQHSIAFGLRIGNKRNRFPFQNPYEITRIDIKGQDSLLRFKLKLRFGKLKLF